MGTLASIKAIQTEGAKPGPKTGPKSSEAVDAVEKWLGKDDTTRFRKTALNSDTVSTMRGMVGTLASIKAIQTEGAKQFTKTEIQFYMSYLPAESLVRVIKPQLLTGAT